MSHLPRKFSRRFLALFGLVFVCDARRVQSVARRQRDSRFAHRTRSSLNDLALLILASDPTDAFHMLPGAGAWCRPIKGGGFATSAMSRCLQPIGMAGDINPSWNACMRAAVAVDNLSTKAAEAWLDDHIDDDDIDEPVEGGVDKADPGIVAYLRKLEYEDDDDYEDEEEEGEWQMASQDAEKEETKKVVEPAVAEQAIEDPNKRPEFVAMKPAVADPSDGEEKYEAELKGFEEQEELVPSVLATLKKLTRAGFDLEMDAEFLPELQKVCAELAYSADTNNETLPIREDTRLVGDWQLVGTTAENLIAGGGLTSMGSAAFSKPVGIFFRITESGEIIAKEVLEFLGQPCVVNELRGSLAFTEDGRWMKEVYTDADIAGQQNVDFEKFELVTKGMYMTENGLRLAMAGKSFFVYKKVAEGVLETWLKSRDLPVSGGTTPQDFLGGFKLPFR